MLVFGDVGELRKVAKSADDLNVLTMREAMQCCFEFVPRGFIFFAAEADRVAQLYCPVMMSGSATDLLKRIISGALCRSTGTFF
jgi:hypothetical protein